MSADIDWNRKTTGAKDPQWDAAEAHCQSLAQQVPQSEYMGGSSVGMAPWVHNQLTDRIIAYHGFHGTWVGWDRGGHVIPLHHTQLVEFLTTRQRDWGERYGWGAHSTHAAGR